MSASSNTPLLPNEWAYAQCLLLCSFDQKRWQKIPDSQRATIMKGYGEFVSDLNASGRFLAGARLGASVSAATLRAVNGKLAVGDGPFAETKEQLGGTVEVRPLLPTSAARFTSQKFTSQKRSRSWATRWCIGN